MDAPDMNIVLNGHLNPVEVGSMIFVPCVRGRGGHGAHILVTKVNKKTFKGIECKRSYIPGMHWTVHKESVFTTLGENEKGLRLQKWHNI